MFSTGFTMSPKPFAETMDGATIEWMREIAIENDLAICGSLIIEQNNYFYNRFVFLKPDGSNEYYDKKHLFSFAGENENYTAGNQKISINFKGWKINPFICYDLRFPVWCRNTNDADILLYVANWPEKRIAHWQVLLPARAIENQAFVIGCNRVGIDFNDFTYTGQSSAFNPLGNQIIALNQHTGYAVFKVDKSVLETIRRSIPFLKDGDKFEFI